LGELGRVWARGLVRLPAAFAGTGLPGRRALESWTPFGRAAARRSKAACWVLGWVLAWVAWPALLVRACPLTRWRPFGVG
jgi:hypothetical protein